MNFFSGSKSCGAVGISVENRKIMFQSSRWINRWFKDRFPFLGWIPRALVQLSLRVRSRTAFLCRLNPSCPLSRVAVDPSWHFSAGTHEASCHWQNGTPQLQYSDKFKLKQGRLHSRVFIAEPQPLFSLSRWRGVYRLLFRAFLQPLIILVSTCMFTPLYESCIWMSGPWPAQSVLMCFTFQQGKLRRVPNLTSTQSWKHPWKLLIWLQWSHVM